MDMFLDTLSLDPLAVQSAVHKEQERLAGVRVEGGQRSGKHLMMSVQRCCAVGNEPSLICLRCAERCAQGEGAAGGREGEGGLRAGD